MVLNGHCAESQRYEHAGIQEIQQQAGKGSRQVTDGK